MMNRDNEDIDGCEGNLRIVARAKRKRNYQIITSDDETGPDDDRAPISTLVKRTSQIITSDDETSCDDTAPISTLVRSRIGYVDEVKEDSSRRKFLKSAKIKRAGKISDDDDDEEEEETSYQDSVPKSTIKTRYRSKRTTGFVQEDGRKHRLTRLRKTEMKNEQDDKNSFDLKKSVCLKEISSSDDEEDNDALEDEEDDNSVEDDGDYEGLEDEEDTDDEQDEEDSDDPEDEEDYDDEHNEEDNESVEDDDIGDSTNKSENAIIDGEGNLGIVASTKRKRSSQIFTRDDETSCDDTAPFSTLMRSRIDSDDEVKGNASRQSLRSAKTKRAGKISDDDDETSYEDSVPKSTIKTRYRSKCTTVFQDARKRRLRSLRNSEIENEQDDMNSPDLKNSIFLEENSSSDDEEDNGALEDEEDYDGEQDKEDNDSVEEDDDGDSYDAINDSEPDMDMSEVYSPETISAKTKRVTQIIVSDDEISYDDNSPTTTLRTQHNTMFSTGYADEVKDDESYQSPTKLTKSESEKEQEDESSCDLNQTIRLDVYSSGDEEDNDGSERDTLDDFIDYSDEKDEPNDEDEPNDADDHELEEVLEPFGRQNVSNQKWDFEGEMLADFGKNTELCMRAVCVLYRQQAADEKAAKETIYRNKRGFSQTDALRGCKLAEFLTDRDPAGILKKTVEELKQHNFKWIKLCHALAAKYSKQLFQIYTNKEDPYFPE